MREEKTMNDLNIRPVLADKENQTLSTEMEKQHENQTT
jgi:hypothetical protein